MSENSSARPSDDELMSLLREVARDQERERNLPEGSLDGPCRELLGRIKGLPNEPDSAPATPTTKKRQRRRRTRGT